MLLFHYSRPVSSVILGEVTGNRRYADDFRGAYEWLEKEAGFYPVFLSVGQSAEDIRMTGYQNQWAKVIGSEIVGRRKDGTYAQRNILRKRGEFPNNALFSFEDVDGIFMDFVDWHLVLNAASENYRISDYEKRLVFKPSWTRARWLSKAREKPHTVQLITEKLYFPDAKRVWVRNMETKRELESSGFENVEVRRIPVDD